MHNYMLIFLNILNKKANLTLTRAGERISIRSVHEHDIFNMMTDGAGCAKRGAKRRLLCGEYIRTTAKQWVLDAGRMAIAGRSAGGDDITDVRADQQSFSKSAGAFQSRNTREDGGHIALSDEEGAVGKPFNQEDTMKAIMVMFDSLNRRCLPPYGCDWVYAPNFSRLAQRSVTFDNAYSGSLPCIPARRELHTGRLNFLHRSWSPLEPFDDSMPEMLHQAGVHTHLISDHAHYWEDGGATYHTRYSTWECVRGQEGDPWKGNLSKEIRPETIVGRPGPVLPFKERAQRQDAVNRVYMRDYAHSCQTRVFDGGLEFIETNRTYDNWFLQIESFDPHEPFFTYEQFLGLYEKRDIGRVLDWPPYDTVKETPEEIEHIRTRYAALLSMCDANLGRVLDLMDRYDMWKDTMLIVNTDHGYLLGEHGWWAKNMMPCYDEIAHIPLFIWDPRSQKAGERRGSLVQTIDLAPTLLEYFGLNPTGDMLGLPLNKTISRDEPVREYALFGYHGGQMNITDGRYVYMHNVADPEAPLYNYTLMPLNMSWRMGPELSQATLTKPFGFTKQMPLLKIPARTIAARAFEYSSQMFDLKRDAEQNTPLDDGEQEARLKKAIVALMRENEAPEELYQRLGLRGISTE